MHILIVEDEPPIADYIENYTRSILGNKVTKIFMVHTLDDAFTILSNEVIDLCLLDLNLKGKNGFSIFKQTVSLSFHTIIISAYTDQAILAFEYGVIDFVPKPFNKDRLRLAFDRYFGRIMGPKQTKYLVYRMRNKNLLLPVEDVSYFQAEDYIVNAKLKDGSVKVLEKPLKYLEQILPKNFLRIHRSYLINTLLLESYENTGNGVYQAKLVDGTCLPLSRTGLKLLNHYLKTVRT